jgi:hypothetical protein
MTPLDQVEAQGPTLLSNVGHSYKMKLIQSIVLILAIIFTSSCRDEKSEHAEVFSFGVIENGVFIHESIGISVEIPSNWETSNFSAIKKAQRSAAKDVINEDPEHTSSNINGAYPLLAISKYPLNKPSRHLHNPTLSITATSKEVLAEFGMDSLQGKMSMMQDVQPPFSWLNQEHQSPVETPMDCMPL